MLQREYKFMKAVIIAGGLGVRLRPLTNKKPKPMLLLDKKPLLEHLLSGLKKWYKRYRSMCELPA